MTAMTDALRRHVLAVGGVVHDLVHTENPSLEQVHISIYGPQLQRLIDEAYQAGHCAMHWVEADTKNLIDGESYAVLTTNHFTGAVCPDIGVWRDTAWWVLALDEFVPGVRISHVLCSQALPHPPESK
jgi:hypothetical protein